MRVTNPCWYIVNNKKSICFLCFFYHYQDTHYSLSKQGTLPYLSLAINYRFKIKRNFLSHLSHSFSRQSTSRERRFLIHLKYFLQIYPLKIWWIQKKVVPLHPLKKTKL